MLPQFRVFLLVAAAMLPTLLLLSFYRTPLEVLQGISLSRENPIATGNDQSYPSQTEAPKSPPSMASSPKNESSESNELNEPNEMRNSTESSESSESNILQAPDAYIPRTMLVIATIAATNNSWVEEELGDLLEGDLQTAFYVTNNLSAPLHTPANKGNEAMAYLTYIIDSYDNLPEISIFLHAHPEAWHNNYLLGMSSSMMIRHLNHEKVERDGYMNLRCHWNPGCPRHLNPMATVVDEDKMEEVEIKGAWKAMFPHDELPEALAQPCCSQFAATRARIRSVPLERYIHFRNWLLESGLGDFLSGRIFEYFWQYILNSTPIFCPDQRICYCDGYNICFENVEDYETYFLLATKWQKLQKQLTAWKEWNRINRREEVVDQDTGGFVQIDPMFQNVGELAKAAVEDGLDPNVVSQWNRGDWLTYNVEKLEGQMSALREQALAAGRDPARKAIALNAAQETPLKVPEGVPEGKLPWWV